MATLTIGNVPPKVVKSLKPLPRKGGRSLEQEVRTLLAEYVGERLALLEEIESGWARQTRRPAAQEIDAWVDGGRP